MELRVLGAGDAAEWWSLRLQALEEEPQAFGKAAEEHRATSVQTMAARFRDASGDDFTVGAFEDQALIGMATFVRDAGLKERHKGRIYGVYVSPSQRRSGVGRALLKFLLQRAQEQDSLEQILLAVAAGQQPANQLYRSLGFQPYGREPRSLKVGDGYIDEDQMILRLK